MGSRRRADLLLVDLNLFESRARARTAIEAGLVTADGHPVRRPSDLLADTARIEAGEPYPWVSRGGVKLAAALDAFGFDAAVPVCLDVGASTGGFTDVLLSRGAGRVYAVDVGQEQLHPRIAADPRVVSLEKTDARKLDRDLVPEPVDLAVVDLSFISVRLALGAIAPLLRPLAPLVVLVKPQFEAGRERVGRGGIVRDEAVVAEVTAAVAAHVESLGFAVAGTVPSPIQGGDGNREMLLGARRVA